jgi:hypothetical protein
MGKGRLKLLLVCSDIHSGSEYGLNAPDCELPNKTIVNFENNAVMRFFWLAWCELVERARQTIGGDAFGFVVNGDAMEGCHHGSAEVIASTLDAHTEIAWSVLRPVASWAAKTWVVEGTEVHTRGHETTLARMLKAQGEQAWPELFLDMNGLKLDIKHHCPTSLRKYLEASSLGILAGNANLNQVRSEHRPSRIFLRGHRHVPGIYSDGHILVGVTGAFQALTRWGRKVATDSVPTCSLILLDWRRKQHGELPEVHHFKKSFPQPICTTV